MRIIATSSFAFDTVFSTSITTGLLDPQLQQVVLFPAFFFFTGEKKWSVVLLSRVASFLKPYLRRYSHSAKFKLQDAEKGK